MSNKIRFENHLVRDPERSKPLWILRPLGTKNDSNQKGLTLTELIVASILISIVLVGVAAFSISLKQMEQTTSEASLLNMQASSALSHIKNNAFIAIGYQGDPGINWDTAATPPYFSFRHDVSNTPIQYDDDEWTIYTDGSIPNTLYVCTQDAAEGPVPDISGACEPPDGTQPDNLVLLNNITAIDFTLETAGQFYFYVEITTRSDPSKVEDPLRNPEVTVYERISPVSHSW